MPGWTTKELRVISEAHHAGYPSISELEAALPRHSGAGIRYQANLMGIRHRKRGPLHWLTVAHAHYAKREAEIRAFNQERYG